MATTSASCSTAPAAIETKHDPSSSAPSTSSVPIPTAPHASSSVCAQTGTKEDPIIVDWAPDDVENPLNWSRVTKVAQTVQVALGTFCVTLGSSTYAGGQRVIGAALHMNNVVTLLGVSLYVLGFGVGPLLWAPCSELYGRKRIFLVSWIPFTLAQLGCWHAQNGPMMLAFRFLAGALGSAPLAGGGGTVSDMYAPAQRTYALALYSTMPFLGPIFGPLIGGSIARGVGWKLIFLVLFCISLFLASLAILVMRETYAPVLLRRRAERLHRESGGKKFFVSKYDVGKSLSLPTLIRSHLSRPFVFLFTEPIVTLMAIYIAIEYAILYAMFAAFPIVFQRHRGWNRVQGGAAYLGIGVGVLLALACIPLQARWYARVAAKSPGGKAPPEARLLIVIVSAFSAPLGLFWFAWTSNPKYHAMIPIAAGAPFGFGIFYLFQGVLGYLMDTYGMYCASAIAATVVLRSVLACAFPLFTPALFTLGDAEALSIFAGLCTLCMPIPILFYKYGPSIRARSKYAQRLATVKAPTGKKPDEEAPAATLEK